MIQIMRDVRRIWAQSIKSKLNKNPLLKACICIKRCQIDNLPCITVDVRIRIDKHYEHLCYIHFNDDRAIVLAKYLHDACGASVEVHYGDPRFIEKVLEQIPKLSCQIMVGPLPITSHVQFIAEEFEYALFCGYAGPGWYFWDETQSACYGPFKDERTAVLRLFSYTTTLDD